MEAFQEWHLLWTWSIIAVGRDPRAAMGSGCPLVQRQSYVQVRACLAKGSRYSTEWWGAKGLPLAVLALLIPLRLLSPVLGCGQTWALTVLFNIAHFPGTQHGVHIRSVAGRMKNEEVGLKWLKSRAGWWQPHWGLGSSVVFCSALLRGCCPAGRFTLPSSAHMHTSSCCPIQRPHSNRSSTFVWAESTSNPLGWFLSAGEVWTRQCFSEHRVRKETWDSGRLHGEGELHGRILCQTRVGRMAMSKGTDAVTSRTEWESSLFLRKLLVGL